MLAALLLKGVLWREACTNFPARARHAVNASTTFSATSNVNMTAALDTLVISN